MRILTISETFPPRKFGGVTYVSYCLSKLLAYQGHSVTVYSTDLGNSEFSRLNVKSYESRENMTIRYFKNLSNFIAFRYRIFIPILLLPIIKKELNRFDILHLHGYRNLLNLVAYHYAKQNGIPYIMHAHGSVLPSSSKIQLKHIFDILFGYKLLKGASKVLALTKSEAEQYRMMGVDAGRIEILPNGIDLFEYASLPKKGEFRKKYLLNDDDKIILYLGRMHHSKGIHLLIEAFTYVLGIINNAKLVLVGPDDGQKSALETLINRKKINKRILFVNYVSTYEKKTAFVDSDVFVSPSYSGFPITFLEACACGIPLITTTHGDHLEWLNDVGHVVPYDAHALANAIVDVLNNEQDHSRFSKNGKDLVRNYFNWEKITTQLVHIYERTVDVL